MIRVTRIVCIERVVFSVMETVRKIVFVVTRLICIILNY